MNTETKERSHHERIVGLVKKLQGKPGKGICVAGVTSTLGINDPSIVKNSLDYLHQVGALQRQRNVYVPNPKYRWA